MLKNINLNLIIKITLEKNNQFWCETTSENPKYLILEKDKDFLPAFSPVFADEAIHYMKTKVNHVFSLFLLNFCQNKLISWHPKVYK